VGGGGVQLYLGKRKEDRAVTLTSGEGLRTGESRVLGSINLAFLRYAGYTDSEIAKLGDLSRLPEQEMQRLMQEKAEKALAEAWKGKPLRSLSGDEEKRQE